MKLNGSEILLECLLEQGVDTVFGYPGGAVLNIYDALYKYSDRIKHYLTSHEQGAAHAADGYSRASGKPGVCIATSGPGATNLVTGIATAYMDSVPIIAITGNVTLPLLGKDSFQEVDIAGITMPITKHNFIVKDVTKLAETIRKAFYIALEGRPGPVLIDITKDVTANFCEYSPQTPKAIEPSTENIKDKALHEAAWAINKAERPLIYAGGGIISSGADIKLRELAEKINSPVCLSMMGLGGFPSSHELFTGMIGMHGTKASNMAATDCDLLIALGARFSDRVISNVKRFAPKAKVLHIDIDHAEINKNVVASCSVVGDVNHVLTRLIPLLEQKEKGSWLSKILELKKVRPKVADDGCLHPQYILSRISEIAGSDAMFATEVGQNQMWTCHYVSFEKPRTFFSSGGLGTMGYGLGASIGAQIANPTKTVFNIAGDGCFRMNNIELAMAVEYNIPIIVVILNNHSLGMVRQWQTLFYDKRFSHTKLDSTTDFIKLAEAYGALAINITKPEEVDSAIRTAIAAKRPTVINCEIDPDEKIFPMVASGNGIDEIMME